MFTQFMMEWNFFTTHKDENIDIGGYRYLTIRKGKDGKEFWICSNQLCSAKTTTLSKM